MNIDDGRATHSVEFVVSSETILSFRPHTETELMGKVLLEITEKERKFIRQQKVFFVATSPLSPDGHVNVSPKSPGTSVVIVDPTTVCYIDLTGSGSETAAHVLENNRMTLMFCNIEEGLPMILRLYGTASFIGKKNGVPKSWLEEFPPNMVSSPGFRGVFKLDIHRISSSCGYSLPVMTFQSYRNVLHEYTDNKGVEGMKEYRLKKNSFSIDGLPSLAHLEDDLVADKDSVIVEDPSEGYIFGKIVKKGSKEYQQHEDGRHSSCLQNLPSAAAIRKQQRLLLLKNIDDTYVIFGIGLMLGTAIAGVVFYSGAMWWDVLRHIMSEEVSSH